MLCAEIWFGQPIKDNLRGFVSKWRNPETGSVAVFSKGSQEDMPICAQTSSLLMGNEVPRYPDIIVLFTT